MKLRKAIILPAIMLASVLLFAGAGMAKADELDLKRTISLKVNAGPASMTELTNENVAIDVYKVADAKNDPVGDVAFTPVNGVTFSKPVDSHAALGALDNADWQTLAQDAAKKIVGVSNSPVQPEKDLTKLSSGLYLIVPQGTTGTDSSGNLTTSIVIGDFTYTWLPELVALPTTVSEMGADGEHTVADSSGDWQYSITATLKPSSENLDEFGDLYITKVLPTYETTTPVTFVFSVIANVEGQEDPVFDDVCSLTFDSNGSKTYQILNRIPVGAEVTVTEVYAGTRYAIKSDKDKTQTGTIIAKDEGTLELTFENTYNPDHLVGYGILNEFTHGENGWVVNQN